MSLQAILEFESHSFLFELQPNLITLNATAALSYLIRFCKHTNVLIILSDS